MDKGSGEKMGNNSYKLGGLSERRGIGRDILKPKAHSLKSKTITIHKIHLLFYYSLIVPKHV